MKKYEFTGETKEFLGITMRRIRAIKSFGDVKAGDIGGWIEKDSNLSHDGNAWVSGDARVYGGRAKGVCQMVQQQSCVQVMQMGRLSVQVKRRLTWITKS